MALSNRAMASSGFASIKSSTPMAKCTTQHKLQISPAGPNRKHFRWLFCFPQRLHFVFIPVSRGSHKSTTPYITPHPAFQPEFFPRPTAFSICQVDALAYNRSTVGH